MESNLVNQSGYGVLETPGDIGKAIDIMSFMKIDGALGTDSILVSFAI